MTLDKPTLAKMISSLYLSDEIKPSEIPDLELYMDQLLSFLNNRLASLKRAPGDKVLTKTMINNYTKDQLLIPPNNKRYSKEHVMLLILIYQLKNVLSIHDIKNLFAPILKDISTPDDDVIPLTDIYMTFLDLKQDQFNEFQDHFNEKIGFINAKTVDIDPEATRTTAEMFLLVLMLVAQANASKRLAEKIIDVYFPGDN